MNEEYKSMQDNKVWELVPLLEGVKLIGCKWMFKTKQDFNGNVERYKARLVAKGYTQKEGIDFKETFSPVSSKDSFRTIMALVAHLGQSWLLLHIIIWSFIKWMSRRHFSMATLMRQFIWCNQKNLCQEQTDKIQLWAKTDISSMVPQISSSHSLIWFRD